MCIATLVACDTVFLIQLYFKIYLAIFLFEFCISQSLRKLLFLIYIALLLIGNFVCGGGVLFFLPVSFVHQSIASTYFVLLPFFPLPNELFISGWQLLLRIYYPCHNHNKDIAPINFIHFRKRFSDIRF